jgi:hypothetical protein
VRIGYSAFILMALHLFHRMDTPSGFNRQMENVMSNDSNLKNNQNQMKAGSDYNSSPKQTQGNQGKADVNAPSSASRNQQNASDQGRDASKRS